MSVQVHLADFKIQPQDIDTSNGLYAAFGNEYTERSAVYVIGLCKTLGNWGPFSSRQIDAFHRYIDPFEFNGLLFTPKNWIVKEAGLFYVSERFIERSYEFSQRTERTYFDSIRREHSDIYGVGSLAVLRAKTLEEINQFFVGYVEWISLIKHSGDPLEVANAIISSCVSCTGKQEVIDQWTVCIENYRAARERS